MKTLNQYYNKSVENMMRFHAKEIHNVFERFPFEEFGERCFRKLIWRFRIRENDILHDECYDAAMQAYLYSCCRCSIKRDYEKFFEAYLYKVMKIYFMCAFVITKHVENIAKENNLRLIKIDSESGYCI